MTEETMKAITLWQPWATLVAIGAKQVETRSWDTPHRGPLAIHAALTDRHIDFAGHPSFWTPLSSAGYRTPYDLPLGKVVAVCKLTDTWSTNDQAKLGELSEEELAFGDYSPNRFAWVLEEIEMMKEPFHARGRQRLWRLELPLPTMETVSATRYMPLPSESQTQEEASGK